MRSVLVGCLAVAGLALQAFGSTVAFMPVNGGFSSNYNAIGNDGFFFTPNTDIAVTALGYYEDGWAHVNPVGIYDVNSQALLVSASVNVPSTAGALPTDPPVFEYVAVSPVVLQAGKQYAVVGWEQNIAGQYVTPPDVRGLPWVTAADMRAAPQVAFNGYQYDYNSTLDLPNTPWYSAYFGPNFQFEAVPVPVPAAAWLGFSMLGGMGVFSKLRKRKNSTL